LRSAANPDAKVPLALEFVADSLLADNSPSTDGDFTAAQLYDELKQVDAMRSGYWEWKKSLLAAPVVA
jgi:hypothetical protein